MRFRALCILFCVLGSSAASADGCFSYSFTGDDGQAHNGFTDINSACTAAGEAYAAYDQAAHGFNTSLESISDTSETQTGGWSCITHFYNATVDVHFTHDIIGTKSSVDCPDPNNCASKSGSKQHISTLDYLASAGSGSCLGGCALTAVPLSSMAIGGSAAYTNVMYAEFTGESCGAADARAGKCFSSAGKVICSEEPQKNCGMVNGDEVCIESVSSENPCVSFDSGAVACLASAPDSAKPDNGTEGTPAQPDAQVVQGDTTVNYYFSTTVNNSSTPVSSNPSDTSGGSSGGGGSGEGEGDECLPGESCAGDLPSQGSAGDCDDFTACFSGFYNRVKASPILASVGGVSAAFPTGSCPSWNLEAFGDSYSLSAPMCEIWDNVSPILSAAFVFIWGWVATRIVLSA